MPLRKNNSWIWAVQFQSLFTFCLNNFCLHMYVIEGPRAKRVYMVTILIEIENCSKIAKFSHAPVISIHFVSFFSFFLFGLFLCPPTDDWKASLSLKNSKSKELLKEMRWVSAEFFEEQVYICTELVIPLPSLLGIPSLWTDPPPLPSEKIRERKEVSDSMLLIVFGGRIIFPRMCGK